jgi:CRISPR/Cas system CMR-associated protein Cmr5 small subunit
MMLYKLIKVLRLTFIDYWFRSSLNELRKTFLSSFQRTSNKRNEQRTTNNEQRTTNKIWKKSITHVIFTEVLAVVCGRCHEKVNQTVPWDFDGKSLFEMTVERNRNIANKVMVVGNIDNCHLSKSLGQIEYLLCWYYRVDSKKYMRFCRFRIASEDILVITHQTILLMKCIVWRSNSGSHRKSNKWIYRDFWDSSN